MARGRRQRLAPPRKQDVEIFIWHLTLSLKCECGERRDIAAHYSVFSGLNRMTFTMPCCLRRYVITEWNDNGPLLKCIGVEVWKDSVDNKPRIIQIDSAGRGTLDPPDPVAEQYRRKDGSLDIGSYIDDMSDDGD